VVVVDDEATCAFGGGGGGEETTCESGSEAQPARKTRALQNAEAGAKERSLDGDMA
jgi:hypothetical protein